MNDYYRKYVRKLTPKDNRILARGKYGYGDSIWLYNIACNTAKTLGEKITVEVHWSWDRNHLHYCDDTENIIDQTDYLFQFYQQKDLIDIQHVYCSSKKNSEILKKGGLLKYGADPIELRFSNWWKFDDRLKLPTIKNKVVVWNPFLNASNGKEGKNILSLAEWKEIYYNLQFNGYDVVEVDYRMPIRELMYHINTASSAIGHAGICYHIANNWRVPCLVVSSRSMVDLHCPCVMRVSDKKVIYNLTLHYSEYGEELLKQHCQDKFEEHENWIENL